MADTSKKYKIQQKQSDGSLLTLHPESEANIVTTTEIKNAAGDTTLVTAGDVQSALQTIARNVETVSKGAVNDVQVKDSTTSSVVKSGIATIDISGKANKATTLAGYGITDGVQKETGKGLSTNDYTTAEKTKLAGIAGGATKVEKSTVNGNIKINGTETVVYTAPTADVYTVAKQATAESGYAATYYLTKNGTKVGDSINIIKDLVVKSGSIVEKDGTKYLQLVLNDSDETKIEVDVTDLVDDYTAGTGITITGRAISVNKTTLDGYYDAKGTASSLVTSLQNGQVATNKANISTNATNIAALQTTLGKIKVTASSVTDGTNTFSKYDDTALAGRVTKLEKIKVTSSSVTDGTNTFTKYDDTALAKRVTANENSISTINAKFSGAVKAGTYSVVQTNESGIVTAAGQIIEIGTTTNATASSSLATGGIFFKLIG